MIRGTKSEFDCSSYLGPKIFVSSARKLKCPSSARLGSARAGKFQLELITSIYSVTQRFGSDEVDCRLSI